MNLISLSCAAAEQSFSRSHSNATGVTLQATPLITGLNDLLEHYGVKLGNNLLLDTRFHDTARFQQGL